VLLPAHVARSERCACRPQRVDRQEEQARQHVHADAEGRPEGGVPRERECGLITADQGDGCQPKAEQARQAGAPRTEGLGERPPAAENESEEPEQAEQADRGEQEPAHRATALAAAMI
jgi:hypothetical protein